MNKEEKKVIEYIRKEFIENWRRKQQRVNKDAFLIYVDKEDIDNIETVLKLIEMQNKELGTYKKIAELFGKSLISISGEKTSLEELIDWARREVKNEKE